MKKISWLDKVTNEENKQTRWVHEIIEGRVRGKPIRGRRIQMLHDLVDDDGDGFVALRWAAEGTEGCRHSQRISKTCSVAEDW